MRVSSLLSITVILVLVISLVCIWFFPSIQDFMASNVMWNGISHFSREFKAENVDSLESLTEVPEDSILVAVPYLEYTENELAAMKRFVDNGGTLLLMDDFGYGNSVLAYLGMEARFTNQLVLDPLFCYKNPAMPRITDFNPKIDGIDEVMLNHATTLTNVAEADVIAWSSSSSFLDLNENSSWDEGEPKGPFTVAAKFKSGKGTVALVADPSTVINTMVSRYDNYAFITYLTGRRGEQQEVFIDRSHLTKAPLDVSKIRLTNTREWLSNPYALLGITALVFVVISRTTVVKKGETLG
ncbi:MAG: DUF4350 domain-containing protein [Dehalococcoidales bacterium]|nr:DUF4350 domain-containing protein [Dehalococcoidales bacterium]